MNREQQLTEILQRLAVSRKCAGLSQSQVAKLVGLAGTAATVSQWENGGRGLDINRFLELCDIYQIDPVWALTGINPNISVDCIFDLRQKLGEADQLVDGIISWARKG